MSELKKMGGALGAPPEALPCQVCGAKIEPKPNPFGGDWWRPAHCPSCVDREIEQEQAQAVDKAWRAACVKHLTEHEFDELEHLERKGLKLCAPLEQLELIQPHGSMRCGAFLVGPAGAGKTTQLNLWLKRRFLTRAKAGLHIPQVMRFLEPALLRTLHHSEFGMLDASIQDDIARVPVLILDEMGTSRGNPVAAAMFYEIIDARYRARRTTIFASNFKLNELLTGTFMPDREGHPLYDDRTVSRIAEMIMWEEGHQEFTHSYRQRAERRRLYDL